MHLHNAKLLKTRWHIASLKPSHVIRRRVVGYRRGEANMGLLRSRYKLEFPAKISTKISQQPDRAKCGDGQTALNVGFLGYKLFFGVGRRF
jgi:hypothetical protein